jgi:predicted metal-binding membrane protein
MFAMWTVMTAGMMVPTASPMLLLFGATRAGSSGRGVSLATLAFGLGYVTVWTGFSAVAALAQHGLHQAAMLSMSMSSSSSRLSGAILIAAGAYQLTPWKGRCLTHCRSPLWILDDQLERRPAGTTIARVAGAVIVALGIVVIA